MELFYFTILCLRTGRDPVWRTRTRLASGEMTGMGYRLFCCSMSHNKYSLLALFKLRSLIIASDLVAAFSKYTNFQGFFGSISALSGIMFA